MKRLSPHLLLPCLIALAGQAVAQAPWRDLPPEERRQMREQMREHWVQERALRGEGAVRPGRDLAPEERQRLRAEMREQRREEYRARHEGEALSRRAHGRWHD